jgi:hypothetical protein
MDARELARSLASGESAASFDSTASSTPEIKRAGGNVALAGPSDELNLVGRRLDVSISLNAATDGIWIPTRFATICFSASVGFNTSIQMIWLGPSWPLENAPSLSRYTLSMFNPIPLPGQVYLLERPLMFPSRDLEE